MLSVPRRFCAIWITISGTELEEFRLHLEDCADCRADFDRSRRFRKCCSERGLYTRASIATRPPQPQSLRIRHQALSAQDWANDIQALAGWAGDAQGLSRFRVPAFAAVILAMCFALIPSTVSEVRAANYVDAAVAEHRSYLNGSLATGLQTNSAEAVTAWFAGKVPFDFRLPTAESTPEDNPAYRLTGAGLVSYKGKPAALVTYAAANDKISLLIASGDSAVVAGGDEVRFARLTFHYRTASGFKVITWTTHGLSYALVSSVSGPARSSCLVCHQNMADHNSFNEHP